MSEISFLEKTTHNETLDYLKSSDVVVLPSRFEGLSMFALEGLATGNLCLFSKTGGLIDLIDDNGFHFEPQSIETLADTLKSVSSLTDGQIVERKKSSLELFEKKFSDRVVAEKFMKVFEIVKSSNNLLID